MTRFIGEGKWVGGAYAQDLTPGMYGNVSEHLNEDGECTGLFIFSAYGLEDDGGRFCLRHQFEITQLFEEDE
jgi:hypothetical protein